MKIFAITISQIICIYLLIAWSVNRAVIKSSDHWKGNPWYHQIETCQVCRRTKAILDSTDWNIIIQGLSFFPPISYPSLLLRVLLSAHDRCSMCTYSVSGEMGDNICALFVLEKSELYICSNQWVYLCSWSWLDMKLRVFSFFAVTFIYNNILGSFGDVGFKCVHLVGVWPEYLA